MIKKFWFAVLGIALLASPLVSSAQTTDVQSQIAALLAQIKALQAQIMQLQGGNPGAYTCIDLSNNIGPDDTDAATNNDVSKLQKFLSQDPSIFPDARLTGYYGPATVKAVQRWQSAHNLISSGDPDTSGYGYVGPKTRNAMGCRVVLHSDPIPPILCSIMYPNCPSGTHAGGTCHQQCLPDNSTNLSVDLKGNGSDGPITVTLGQQVTWSWTSTGARSCDYSWTGPYSGIAFGNGTSASNTVTPTPAGTFTSTVKCTNSAGESASDSVAMTVAAASSRLVFDGISNRTVSASYYDLPANSQIVLVNQGSGQSIGSPAWLVNAGGSGSIPIALDSNVAVGTYYLKAQTYGTQTYLAQSAPFYFGGTSLVVDLKGNGSDGPITVTLGQQVTWSWTSSGATSCSYSWMGPTNGTAFGHGTSESNTVTPSPAGTFTSTVICYNAAQQSARDTVTMNVVPPPGPSVPVKLSSSCSTDNSHVTLAWANSTDTAFNHLRINDPSNDGASCADTWYCANSADQKADNYKGASYTAAIVPGKTYQWWVHAVDSASRMSAAGVGTPFKCGQNQPTCTFGWSTIVIEGGSAACRAWCTSSHVENYGDSTASCLFKDTNGVSQALSSESSSASDRGANLANALTALESTLQAIIKNLGR